MKKALLLFIAVLLAAFLVACGDSDSDSDASADSEDNSEQESNEESSDTEKEDAADEADQEESADGEVYEFNQEIADTDNFKATLVRIEKSYDDFFDSEIIEVAFEVENKLENALEFQARQVSINGKMVDESLLIMSTEVAGGKSADAVLTIQDFEGGELPALEGDFEMLLHVFDWEDFDFEDNAEVSVDFE